jgi:hypothetical protein
MLPGTMNGVVLVLNQNYEPLNVCNLPRAFRLLFGEKAEVIEFDHQVIRTPRTEYRAPSVIRLQHHVKRSRATTTRASTAAGSRTTSRWITSRLGTAVVGTAGTTSWPPASHATIGRVARRWPRCVFV